MRWERERGKSRRRTWRQKGEQGAEVRMEEKDEKQGGRKGKKKRRNGDGGEGGGGRKGGEVKKR